MKTVETVETIVENVHKLAKKNAYDFGKVIEELRRTFAICSNVDVKVKYKPRVRNEFDSYNCIGPHEIYISCPADDLILVFIHEIDEGYNKRIPKSWFFENLYIIAFTKDSHSKWKYAGSYCIDKTYKHVDKALPQFKLEILINGETVLYVP